MVGMAVDAGDDDVGRALELVIETTLDESAEHRMGRLVAMQREAADVRF